MTIPENATYVLRFDDNNYDYILEAKQDGRWVQIMAFKYSALHLVVRGVMHEARLNDVSLWNANSGKFLVGDVGQLTEDAAEA